MRCFWRKYIGIVFWLILFVGGFLGCKSVALAACSGTKTFTSTYYKCPLNSVGLYFCEKHTASKSGACTSTPSGCGFFYYPDGAISCKLVDGGAKKCSMQFLVTGEQLFHSCSGSGSSSCKTPSCTQPSGCTTSAACANLGGTCGCTVASGCRSGTTVTGICPGGSDCVCVIPTCVPNCNESGSYCAGTPYTGNCGQTCTGTIPAANGTSGSCGGSNGGIYVTQPTDLCASGNLVWTDSGGTDGTYDWYCAGTAGNCGGATGSTAYCSATRDFAPTFSSLTLQTYDGSTNVAAENGDRNQICQTVFKNSSNPNGVRFVVSGVDIQGVGDISTIQVRLRGSNTYTFSAVYASNGVAVIPVDLAASGVATGTYNIEVLINDVHASAIPSSWIDTGRDFKYWNCQVPVSGTMYDGSKGGYICPNFGSLLATEANFRSLYFKQTGVDAGVDTNVSGTGYSSKSGQYFYWGDNKTYAAQFNSDLAADTGTMDIKLNNSCTQEMGSFRIESVIDPYSNTLSLIADFLAVVDQDAWFQSIDGGIFGKSVITDYVPVTCVSSASCSEGMSLRALVAAPTINRTSDVPYSFPNDWHTQSDLVNKINYYEKYKAMGVGAIINGDLSDLSEYNQGLVLVNGNINITQDKTIGVGGFLMLMASGNITIDPSVTRFDGVLVGNNINVGGDNDNQLVINGSLYGLTQVNISRTYTTKRKNNTSPAVVVNFRPDFIFNIPSGISRKVVDWKWGN